MASHNLKTVIGFEFFRVLKKKRFWVTTLAIPAALAVVFGLVFISGQSSSTPKSQTACARIGAVSAPVSEVKAPQMQPQTSAHTTSSGLSSGTVVSA